MWNIRRNSISKTAVAAIAAFSMGAVVATAVWAQTLPRNQAELEQQLGLTAAQKDKLKKIDAKYKPQLEALDKKYRPQFEALRNQYMALEKQRTALQTKANADLKPIVDKQRAEAQAVFTPAQTAKMKQIQEMAMKQQQSMMQGGMGAPVGGAPMGAVPHK